MFSFPRERTETEAHLCLRQLQLFRELHPLGDGQIFIFLKLRLECLDLSRCEGCPRSLLPVVTEPVLVLWKMLPVQ